MAHSCPECGQACYCCGDIDDIFFDEYPNDCIHCLGRDDLDNGDEDLLCIDTDEGEAESK